MLQKYSSRYIYKVMMCKEEKKKKKGFLNSPVPSVGFAQDDNKSTHTNCLNDHIAKCANNPHMRIY